MSVTTWKTVEWTKVPVVTIIRLASVDPFAGSVNFDVAKKAEQKLTASKQKLEEINNIALWQ